MTQQTYQSGLLFTQAHKLVRGRIYDVLAPYNLTPSCWAILSIAAASSEGIRLANVAKALDMKPPLVTILASNLIEKGYINRVPHHTDKRAKLLVATAKGRRISSTVEQEIGEQIGVLLGGLSGQEIVTFQKVLETIIRHADSDVAANHEM